MLIKLAVARFTLGSVGELFLQHTLLFLLPMMLVVMALGIGIPNVLSRALIDYRQAVGSASAIFGLNYYAC
ncbi:hypothetical protein ACPV4B_18040 [Vibrio parahaemolyticus]|uniref:hypothetical protein n=1 Tax=Vibrio mediterranei TaxID=689 RepID=UPI0040677B2F